MKDRKFFVGMGILAAIVLALWLGSFFVITCFFGRPQNPGTTGDLFGAVGSLFSGLAFVGVIGAIFFQRADLKATLDEMKQAREAHEESADTLKAQVEVQRLQVRAQILTSMVDGAIASAPDRFRSQFSATFYELGMHDSQKIKEFLQELLEINSILKGAAEKPEG